MAKDEGNPQMTNDEKSQLECCTPFLFALNRSPDVRDSCFVIRHSSFVT
jgi:hypothetical protein